MWHCCYLLQKCSEKHSVINKILTDVTVHWKQSGTRKVAHSIYEIFISRIFSFSFVIAVLRLWVLFSYFDVFNSTMFSFIQLQTLIIHDKYYEGRRNRAIKRQNIVIQYSNISFFDLNEIQIMYTTYLWSYCGKRQHTKTSLCIICLKFSI